MTLTTKGIGKDALSFINITEIDWVLSLGGTTNRNRNVFINKALRFFYCLLGNILATNRIIIVRSVM